MTAKEGADPAAARAAVAGTHRAEQAVDEVPEDVREAARRAFADRDQHAEVMTLRHDSLLTDRPPGEARQIVFADPSTAEVAVTVRALPPEGTVEVEVTSVGGCLLEVRCGGERFPVDGPERALVGPAPHGLLSVVLEDEVGRRLRTAWIRV